MVCETCHISPSQPTMRSALQMAEAARHTYHAKIANMSKRSSVMKKTARVMMAKAAPRDDAPCMLEIAETDDEEEKQVEMAPAARADACFLEIEDNDIDVDHSDKVDQVANNLEWDHGFTEDEKVLQAIIFKNGIERDEMARKKFERK